MWWKKIQILDWGWKITDGNKGRFCKKIWKIPKSATNRGEEHELGKYSRKGKKVCLAAKY